MFAVPVPLLWMRGSLAMALLLVGLRVGTAAEQVKRLSGKPQSGEVQEISLDGIKIKVGAKVVNVESLDAISVTYAGQPALLTKVMKEFADGKFDEVLKQEEALAKETSKEPAVLAEQAFYPAAAAAKLAQAGQGDVEAARTKLKAFLDKHADSYRAAQVYKLLAELSGQLQDHAAASGYGQQLAKLKSPLARRAGMLIQAQAAIARDQPDAARKWVEELKDSLENADAVTKVRVQLVSAACDIAENRASEVVVDLQKMLAELPADQPRLHAEAYNLLGLAQEKSGNMQDAALAYLHTELLYFQDPQLHAQALKQLVSIWEQLNLPHYAAEAQATLRERYPQFK